MQPIERDFTNTDWITLLLLLVVFLLVLASIIDKKRFRDLFALPYNNFYTIQYGQEFFSAFTIIIFVATNLIISLFFYLFFIEFIPVIVETTPYLYFNILGLLFLYWAVRYGLEYLISFLFEIKEIKNKATFIKMNYFYSSAFYVLIGVVFAFYTRQFRLEFLYVSASVFIILLLIRYYHFIGVYKSYIFSHFFYFILYLCALEIAPLFVVAKIGVKLIG